MITSYMCIPANLQQPQLENTFFFQHSQTFYKRQYGKKIWRIGYLLHGRRVALSLAISPFSFIFLCVPSAPPPPLPLYSVSCPNCLYPHSLLDVAMQVPAHSHTYKRTHALIKEVFCSARLRYSVWFDRSSVVLYLV